MTDDGLRRLCGSLGGEMWREGGGFSVSAMPGYYIHVGRNGGMDLCLAAEPMDYAYRPIDPDVAERLLVEVRRIRREIDAFMSRMATAW